MANRLQWRNGLPLRRFDVPRSDVTLNQGRSVMNSKLLGALVANVGDRVFFDFDRSTLKEDARATLDRQAGWLGKYPQVNVQVAGNCDDRGTEEYNLALGQRRANASRDYLVARGVDGTRISTISFGKDRPTALGDNEQAWAQNRNTITSVR